MQYATSRNFDLPTSATEMKSNLWFNLWSKRFWPYLDPQLEPGSQLYWYESKNQRLRWLTEIVFVDRFEYSGKKQVVVQLGLTGDAARQAYLTEGPDNGYCLAIRVKPIELLDREKPEGFRFPMLGWLKIDATFLKRWSLSGDASGSNVGIPEGLKREHVIEAIRKLERGDQHAFGESTGYDVLFEGRRYPPKAVIGLAAEALTHNPLGPYDFKGGLKSKCFRELERLGFDIVRKGDVEVFPEELPEQTYLEGAAQQILVNRYERDPAARARCIAHHGLSCQVCGVLLEERYGEIAAGFIHVHHLQPLSQMRSGAEVDPVRDLAPVCPNCHAMLHRREPPLSISELKSLICHR